MRYIILKVIFITLLALSSLNFKCLSPGVSAGEKIVFTSKRDGGNNEIYTMNINGTNVKRLTYTTENEEYPCFSPDGTKIVYIIDTFSVYYLYIININGNGKKLVFSETTGDMGYPTFSPDGNRIFFEWQKTNCDIYSINIDGTNLKQITNSVGNANHSPSPSPDGSKILVSRVFGMTYKLYLYDFDGTDGSLLVEAPMGGDHSPSYSPDGSMIVFTRRIDGSSPYQIYTMNSDGTNIKRLTNHPDNDEWPTFSPDGSKILFQSDRDGNNEIYVMNIDGSNVKRLTYNSADDTYPCFAGKPR